MSEPAFHTDDLEQVAEYRSVSALAIISLLFGLASPLCLVWPLLLVIPLVGAALSLVALLRIAASDGVLAGRWAAVAGLALCVGFGAAAITRERVTRLLRTRQAAAFAHDWIAMVVAGGTEPAFRLTVDAARPAPRSADPALSAPDVVEPYDAFLERPVIQRLMAAGSDARIQFVETTSYQQPSRSQIVVHQRFTITPPPAAGDSPEPAFDVVVSLQRSRLPREQHRRWLISQVEDPQAAPSAATP